MKPTRERNIVLYCIYILIVLALILPVCFISFAAFLPPIYDDTYLGEMKYKVERLKQTKGQKIVIIGGSSVAFGIDSALIEEYLPSYTVINFGMYAALGTKFMLDIAEHHINEGDIVILSPEQNAQTLSLYFNSENFWQCADGAISLYSYLKGNERERALSYLPEFAMTKFRYFTENRTLDTSDIYSRSSFNAYGDIKSSMRKNNIMFGGTDINNVISLSSETVSEEFIDYVNVFYDKVTNAGARLYYRFSPMNKLAVEGDAEKYYQFLNDRLKCSIIGNPYDCIMDCEWFYDTNFHLNDSGVILNTKNLITDIKTQLFDSSPTDIEIPEKPVIENNSGTGDNSCRDMFTYKISGNEVILTGLTDIGRQSENLTIPYNYSEGIVAGFTADVFKDNSVLKSLTIQNNVKFIYDNSFVGCSSLEKLIIINDKPNTISIGKNLLNGTSTNIYVPENAYATFVTNYSWAQYHKRIFTLN